MTFLFLSRDAKRQVLAAKRGGIVRKLPAIGRYLPTGPEGDWSDVPAVVDFDSLDPIEQQCLLDEVIAGAFGAPIVVHTYYENDPRLLPIRRLGVPIVRQFTEAVEALADSEPMPATIPFTAAPLGFANAGRRPVA